MIGCKAAGRVSKGTREEVLLVFDRHDSHIPQAVLLRALAHSACVGGPNGGHNALGTGGREVGGMVAVRQPILVLHHRNDRRLWRHSTSQKEARVVAVLIAFLGLTLSGIIIAVAVEAATLALASHR